MSDSEITQHFLVAPLPTPGLPTGRGAHAWCLPSNGAQRRGTVEGWALSMPASTGPKPSFLTTSPACLVLNLGPGLGVGAGWWVGSQAPGWWHPQAPGVQQGSFLLRQSEAHQVQHMVSAAPPLIRALWGPRGGGHLMKRLCLRKNIHQLTCHYNEHLI